MKLNNLYNIDCVQGLSRVPEASIDLAFADPPFNIGYKYDVYEDRLAADEYIAWTKKWGELLIRTLKQSGAFWLAIGDDFAAELKILFQRELGLVCRSWIVWYYTFGVNCKNKFSRSHTHLFYFVKDAKHFTFNKDNIRVPSARQLVYNDSRADKKGRLPDDTWILRPQDATGSFTSVEDVWYFPRVCGTFKERAGWHGCQMPEQLLGRIIKACSSSGDTILDPFAGSGTTLAVAKKLGRSFIGFELSKNYAKQIQKRLNKTKLGDPLSGSEEQNFYTPSVMKVKRRKVVSQSIKNTPIIKRSSVTEVNRGIAEAFFAVRNGFPVDRVIADPEINEQFTEMCVRLGLPGKAFDWNQRLMNLRKAGFFRGLPRAQRTTFPFEQKEFDRYKFACEIAIVRFEHDCEATLDHVLCDPVMASEFDEYILSMLPDRPDSLKIRWFALRIRKRAKYIASTSAKLESHIPIARKTEDPFGINLSKVPAGSGLYWLAGNDHLYVGETENLRERFEVQFNTNNKFSFWDNPLNKLQLSYKVVNTDVHDNLSKHQYYWISKWRPIGNYTKLATQQ